MKQNIIRLALLVLLFVVTGTVLAVSGSTSYTGWVGTGVVAEKDAWVSGGSWNGHIESYSHINPIGTLGWTYWTVRETCNGSIINQYVYSGYAEYNDTSVWDTAVDSISYCASSPSGHEGRVLGNHEFKNYQYGQLYTWYKDWTHIENHYWQDY